MPSYKIICSLIISALAASNVAARPTIRRTIEPRNDVGSASSGSGGSAVGGSVNTVDQTACPQTDPNCHDTLIPAGGLLDLFSDNAGEGGMGTSGSSHGKGSTTGSTHHRPAGNAASGSGGDSAGGSVGSSGLINLWSANAGDGGAATSGSSEGDVL